MKRAIVVSMLASIALALAVMAGCNGCALIIPEGTATYEITGPE